MPYSIAMIDSTHTHYEYNEQPKGDLVILLHGGTVPSWCFDAQIPFLNQLGFKTLRYDMFGRGQSDAPEGKYDREFYFRQLDQLLSHLKITKPFYLVGTSFGGATSCYFASRKPELVKKIILLSPAINWISHQPLAKLLRIPVFGHLLFQSIGKVRVKNRAIGLMKSLNDDIRETYTSLFLKQLENEGFWLTLFKQLNSNALDNYFDTIKSIPQDMNISIMWGDADDEIKENDIRDFKQCFPKVQITAELGSGHGLMAEQPEKVNQFIKKNILPERPAV
jgi:pimeloyl-ACP methyl ester carboxylesterase